MEKMSIIEYVFSNDEINMNRIFSTIKDKNNKSLKEILIALMIPFDSVENGLLISVEKEENKLKLICLTDEEAPSFKFIKNIKDYYINLSCQSKRIFATGKDFFKYKKIRDEFFKDNLPSPSRSISSRNIIKFLLLNTASKTFFEIDVLIKKTTPKYLFFEPTPGLYREKISLTEVGSIDKNSIVNHNGFINISCFCNSSDITRCKNLLCDYVKEKLEVEQNKIKNTLDFIEKIK